MYNLDMKSGACFICYQGESDEHPLLRVCKCEYLTAHGNCVIDSYQKEQNVGVAIVNIIL
jgi:hypothetical protein